jgi:hypothetical protein
MRIDLERQDKNAAVSETPGGDSTEHPGMTAARRLWRYGGFAAGAA